MLFCVVNGFLLFLEKGGERLNGYTMLADSYKKMLETAEPSDNKIDIYEHIKVLEFLGTCNDSEINKLFDSSALNDIVKGYCKKAMQNKGVDDEIINDVIRELGCLFSEKTAKDILKN